MLAEKLVRRWQRSWHKAGAQGGDSGSTGSSMSDDSEPDPLQGVRLLLLRSADVSLDDPLLDFDEREGESLSAVC